MGKEKYIYAYSRYNTRVWEFRVQSLSEESEGGVNKAKLPTFLSKEVTVGDLLWESRERDRCVAVLMFGNFGHKSAPWVQEDGPSFPHGRERQSLGWARGSDRPDPETSAGQTRCKGKNADLCFHATLQVRAKLGVTWP